MNFTVVNLLSLLSYTFLVTSPALCMIGEDAPKHSPILGSALPAELDLDSLIITYNALRPNNAASDEDLIAHIAAKSWDTMDLDQQAKAIDHVKKNSKTSKTFSLKSLVASYDAVRPSNAASDKDLIAYFAGASWPTDVEGQEDLMGCVLKASSLLKAPKTASSIEATSVDGLKKVPLVVFLNPAGIVGDLESSLFAPEASGGYTLLVPNAVEYGYNWFPVNVDLMPYEVVMGAFGAAEPAYPGILEFAQKTLPPFIAELKVNPVASGELQETNPIIIEAKAKGYLEPFVSILARQFSDFIWKGYLDKIDNYITTNLEMRGLSNEDLILGGCSFGAITALQLAFKRPEPCRAVIAANGLFLPPKEVRSVPRNIFMNFGEVDDVIPYWMQLLSYNLLKIHVPAAEMFASKTEGHAAFPGSEQLESLRTQFARHIRP